MEVKELRKGTRRMERKGQMAKINMRRKEEWQVTGGGKGTMKILLSRLDGTTTPNCYIHICTYFLYTEFLNWMFSDLGDSMVGIDE